MCVYLSGRCISYTQPKVTHAQVWRQTHTLLSIDTPFPALVDMKCWDAIEYCDAVPALLQGICVVPPFPADLIASPCWDLS